MKIVRHILWYCLVIFLSTMPTVALSALEDWKTHTSMNEVTGLVREESWIFGSSGGGLFFYDEEDSFYVYYTNMQGLPDNDLTTVEKGAGGNLWIGTSSKGLVRFNIWDKSFVTFSDFERLRINSLLPVGDSLLYVGMEDGVSLFLTREEEVKENYFQLSPLFEIKTGVTDIAINDGKIFCTTSIGVAWADLSHPNLKDPTAWDSVPHWAPMNIITFHNSEIILGSKEYGFFKLDLEAKRITPMLSNENKENKFKIHDFVVIGGVLNAATSDGLYRYDTLQWLKRAYVGTKILSLETSGDSLLVLGFANKSIGYWSPGKGEQWIPPMRTPANNTFVDIALDHNGVVWTSSGFGTATTLIGNPGLHRYQDNQWNWYGMEEGFFYTNDIMTVEVDHKGRLWIGTWGGKTWEAEHGGAYVLIDDGTFPLKPDTLYAVDPASPKDPDEEKILLPTIISHYIVCPDIEVAPSGEIWIANYIQESPLDQRYPYPPSGVVVVDDFPVTRYARFFPHDEEIDGTIIEGIATSQVGVVKADSEGNVWLGGLEMGGLTLLMTNGTPFDKTDDKVKKFTMGDGLLSNNIADIAIDHEGTVWVGTEGGVNAITLEGDEFQILNCNSDLDLPSNEVNAIEVDPSNNKWFGTKGGLVFMDVRTSQTTLYTTQNSGLVNDKILSLLFDETGEVLWIGTAAGISEFYVGKTSQSGHRVLVHPNPVVLKKGHNMVTFSYLGKNTTLRIFTSAGELVSELTPEWAPYRKMYTAEWNLANFSNNLVGSGIYFFVGTDENGKKIREKFAVVR